MGATRRELVALEEEGLLVPRTRIAKIKSPWRIADGTALVSEVLTPAVPVAEEGGNWETLLSARNRREVSLTILVEAIREGRLPVGQRVGVPGFHGVVVGKKSVDDFTPTHRTAESRYEIDLDGGMSAAAFGRSVGLRDDGNFIALIEAGQTSATLHTNSKDGTASILPQRPRHLIIPPALRAAAYPVRGTWVPPQHAEEPSCGVPSDPFVADGHGFAPVYLGSEAAKALG